MIERESVCEPGRKDYLILFSWLKIPTLNLISISFPQSSIPFKILITLNHTGSSNSPFFIAIYYKLRSTDGR